MDDKEPDMPTYRAGTLAGWKGSKSSGREAAFAVSKDLGRRQQEVFNGFSKRGHSGCTCDDLEDELGLPAYTIRPRASELERKGRLFAIGKRLGRMGYKVTIYSVVKPEAEAAWHG